MKLLVYGINYAPELTGIGKYTGDMVSWFAVREHSVRILTAPPYYPGWKIQSGYRRYWWQLNIEHNTQVLRCPMFVPRKPKTGTRMLHLTSFAFSSFFPLLSQWRWKPDVIVLIAPTLFCAPGVLLLSWLCRTPCVLHIQDYEVDALFGLGNTYPGVINRIAMSCERWLLRRFDRVSTISFGMLRRAEAKGVSSDRLIYFPNWSELAHFRNARPSIDLLRKLGAPKECRVLLYSGNIGEKQGLELLLTAADALRNRGDLYFLIVGEGAGKAALLERAAEMDLPNLGFAPLQPWEHVPSLLASAAVHLIIQKRGVADAVLPSKLTNVLAVGGNAVITADPHTTLGQLCLDFPGIATLVEPESLESLLSGIEVALEQSLPNSVAQDYAKSFLGKDNILRQFESDLLALIGSKS